MGAFIFVLSSLKLPSVTSSTSHPTALLIYRYIFVFLVVSMKMNTAQKLRLGNSREMEDLSQPKKTAILGIIVFDIIFVIAIFLTTKIRLA